MTDRPIIFSAPMVRALLAGRKSMTRRIIKPAPEFCGGGRAHDPQNWNDQDDWGWENYDAGGWDLLSEGYMGRPFYATGDRLWVRECWRTASAYDDLSPSQMGGEEPIRYEADQTWQTWGWGRPHSTGRHRAARHMPRWASRLTLLVTDVRVQRLQEISEDDAKAEGADDGFRQIVAPGNCPEPRCDGVHYGPLWHFRDLWNSIHGPDAWDANPWVAAISFTVHRCNIDTMEEGTW